MNPKHKMAQQASTRSSAKPGFENVVLRLVKGGPERLAIEAGQIDAIVDPGSGRAILLPEAQRALTERNARLRSLVALCSDWTWEQDEDYRFVACAGARVGSSGLDDVPIIGKTLWELPVNNVSEAEWQTHRTLLEWRTTFRDLELRYLDRAGNEHCISLNGEPTFDEHERFTGYRGTTRDITGRKPMEDLLQTSYTVADPVPDAGRKPAIPVAVANSLLAALPQTEYHRLLAAGLESVTLKFGEVLHEAGVPIRHVYFPIDCAVALLTTVKGRQAVEVALVGNDGMIGIPLALGIYVSYRRALVQGSGTAMRMESTLFRQAVLQSKTLQQALYRYKHALIGQIGQCVACSLFHSVQARLARYLLMTGDYASSGEIRLKHEFLARMLGVQRGGVSHAASALQKRKLIKCSRGKITILDRKRLRAASCECYQVIKRIRDSTHADT